MKHLKKMNNEKACLISMKQGNIAHMGFDKIIHRKLYIETCYALKRLFLSLLFGVFFSLMINISMTNKNMSIFPKMSAVVAKGGQYFFVNR